MPMVRASWQLSAAIAVVLFAGYAACRLAGRPHLARLQAFCLQFGVVVAIFALYQHTAHHPWIVAEGARERALWIVDAQRRMMLPSELTIQQWVLPFPPLVWALNAYYAGLHLTSMTAFLIWIWWRHRRFYVLACVTVAGTTLICVALQNISVAPPRLLPELGYVDTALEYGQSMYGPPGTGIAAQLAAMPSIHVAWAGIIAAFAVAVSTSRWRWVVAAHFVVTCFVVVATANHWWLDGVVGVVIAALVLGLARLMVPSRRAASGVEPTVGAPPGPELAVAAADERP